MVSVSTSRYVVRLRRRVHEGQPQGGPTHPLRRNAQDPALERESPRPAPVGDVVPAGSLEKHHRQGRLQEQGQLGDAPSPSATAQAVVQVCSIAAAYRFVPCVAKLNQRATPRARRVRCTP